MSFVMSYFTADDEALYLAESQDGYRFTAVGGGPVLRGAVGNGVLRDPFIGPGPDGRFHLLATDGWASESIVHAVSPDLRTWSGQELIPVMAGIPGARNAWAPEFFYDPGSRCYQLIWSSVVEPHGTADGGRDWQGTSQDHRIWGCVTSDFRSFSAAGLFFDPGFSVIDATVARDGDRFLMAFKDERGVNQLTTSNKHIALTAFTSVDAAFDPPYGPVSPAPVEGPALFRRDGEWVLIFDHFLEGRYGAVSSRDGVTWSPADITVPPGTRHASVLSLSSASPLTPRFKEQPS